VWAAQQQSWFEQERREKAEETLQTITGGDSFAYFSTTGLSPGATSGLLVLVHQGEYPLYDLTARWVDLRKFDKIKGNITIQNFTSADTNMTIGSLTPGFSRLSGPLDLGSSNERGFNIFFTARNGGFTQELRFRRVDNQWLSATRVTRHRTEAPLYERIDDEYPRNDENEIEW